MLFLAGLVVFLAALCVAGTIADAIESAERRDARRRNPRRHVR